MPVIDALVASAFTGGMVAAFSGGSPARPAYVAFGCRWAGAGARCKRSRPSGAWALGRPSPRLRRWRQQSVWVEALDLSTGSNR